MKLMTGIEFTRQDITSMEVDAIVCPAHKHLIRGRGLSAQIYDKAGDQLVGECSTLEKCGIGEARLTKGYNLPATYIIHTVTPQWSSGDQWGAKALEQLGQCYESVVQLAIANGVRSLVFPALGAGTNRIPHSVASHVGLEALKNYADKFERLAVCLKSRTAEETWLETYRKFYPDFYQDSNQDKA